MISKTYLKNYEKYLLERQRQQRIQEYVSQFCNLYGFEHIGAFRYRVPNSECQAQVGESINARFVHPRMKFANDYLTGIFKVYAKDNEYTYITKE